MTPYPRQVCAIPQPCLGLRGHLITNLPQAMLLLIIYFPKAAWHKHRNSFKKLTH
jgi:hypothetical protein